MSGAELAAIVGGIATAAKAVPDAIEKIDRWVNGDGEVPLDVLPELPDFTKNHLEHAAMIERARRAGTIP